MTQLIMSSSAVWGRNKPDVNTLVLARVEQVRLDQRLLLRFVAAGNNEDLHLAGVRIEHGSERLVTPMVLDSMPMMAAVKGVAGVPGQTKPHHGFAVASLKGILPQARALVLQLQVPQGAEGHVFGSLEPVRDSSEGEEEVAFFRHQRRYPSGQGYARVPSDGQYPLRRRFTRD